MRTFLREARSSVCYVKKRTARDGKNRAAKSENRGERKREFLNEEAAERPPYT
jgi:hypothetical protein